MANQSFSDGDFRGGCGVLSCSTWSGNSPFLRPENMVHHTMKTSNNSAPSASSNNKVMDQNSVRRPQWMGWIGTVIVGSLTACSTVTLPPLEEMPPPPARTSAPTTPAAEVPERWIDGQNPPVVDAQTSTVWQWADRQPLPSSIVRSKSTWVPVRWSDIPGWGTDGLHQAWNAWIRSCERPAPAFRGLCNEMRPLSIASPQEQHEWVMQRLQPYRIQPLDGGPASGLLTGYYEPILTASRTPDSRFRYPLHRPPASLRNGQPWFSREEISVHPTAIAELQGREIAWVDDPIDAMLLHIQGSGRLALTDPQGNTQITRVAFAGTNNQPFRSITSWLARQGVPSAPWPDATKAWVRQNPDRIDPLLWSNPRYVFFREEPLSELDAQFGPKGAQGVPLTPGRSIAVDRDSVPYGTPVWLRSFGPTAQLQRLVMAQDTGSAIVGAVRADFFTGWGNHAFMTAARMKQPLELWALWPRNASTP